MKHHLRLVCAMAAIAVASLNIWAQKKPDFAFPQQVESHSRASMDRALRDNDGPQTLRSLIDLVLAKSAVEGEVVKTSVQLIDSVAELVSAASTSSMLRLLKARVLLAAYNSQKWVYNQRSLPLTPLPEDISEWSGDQFRGQIFSLCDSATRDTKALAAQPISSWTIVVDIKRQSLPLYPTLLEFACSEAVSIIEDCRVQPLWTPRRLLCGWEAFLSQPVPSASNSEVKLLTQIFDRWIGADKEKMAPLIEADLTRIDVMFGYADSAAGQEALRSLYDSTKSSEWSGMVLLKMRPDDNPTDTLLISNIKHNIAAFPAFIQRPNLEEALANAYEAGLQIEVPGLVVPGDSISIDVVKRNLPTGRIDIYKVKGGKPWEEWIDTGSASTELVNTIPIEGNVGEWPERDSANVKAVIKQPGRYVAIPSLSNEAAPTRDNGGRVIFCSEIALIAHGDARGVITAVNTKDGKPMANVDILDSKNNRLGRTASDGSIAVPSDFNGSLWGRIGESVTPTLYVGRAPSVNKNTVLDGHVYTSLPLYRPGDVADWAAALFLKKGKEMSIAADVMVKAVVNDANGRTLRTDTLTTDQWGRVTSQVKLPVSGLQGNFRIIISALEGTFGTVYGNFTVSDYKLPTFEVLVDQQSSGVTPSGGYKAVLDVKSYSGFPIEGAALNGVIGVESFFNGRAEFATVNAVSDATGRIEVEIPSQTFDDSPFKSRVFFLQASVTSPSGESVMQNLPINIGEEYVVTLGNTTVMVNDGEVRLPITVTRGGKPGSLPIDYEISSAGKVMLKGRTTSSSPMITVDSIPSGSYAVKLSTKAPDCTLAGNTDFDLIIYRVTDTVPPVKSVLWAPVSGTLNIGGRRANVQVGTSYPTHLLIQTLAGEQATFRILSVPAGLHTLSLDIPEDATQASVNIAAMANGKFASQSWTLVDTAAVRALKFEVISFRDRTISNSSEVWKIRLRAVNSHQTASAVILDMFNSSLSALSPGFNWGVAPPQRPYPYARWTVRNIPAVSVEISSPVKNFKTVYLYNPAFQTWGMGFGVRRGYLTKQLMIRGRGVDEVSVESNGVMMESAKMTMAAADQAAVVEDSEVEYAGAKDSGASMSEDANADFRDAEVALGLFRPMLVTEPDGSLTISVTFPNANTRWQVLGTAFNSDLLADTWRATVVTSKPVMVQPNLPRFLRRGDSTQLSALVMNNSDAPALISIVIELFNPDTGATLNTINATRQLPPMGSATVAIPVDAGYQWGSLIGYRISASHDGFTDAEQTVIPVLEAQSRVIESRQFCIPAGQKDFTIQVPENWSVENTVLQYCDNPVWTVVSALPGLLQGSPSTANQAAQTIFSAAMARRILQLNPEISKALKEWTKSDRQDITLVSMLSRNETLKTLVLTDTPWLSAAESQTERMSRLALLLDDDAIDASIQSGINALKNLQTDGGGWKWSGGSSGPSRWATEAVLELMGTLSAQGALPKDKELNSAIKNALTRIDDITAKEYKKHPGGNYTEYTAMRLLFPQFVPSQGAEAVISATVQNLIGRWQNLGVRQKAMAARILYNRNYGNIANQILSSLDEYARSNPQQGMFWPSLSANRADASNANLTTANILQAYQLITPDSEQVPLISQWLTLQKQGQDWGTAAATTQVVASVVEASQDWLAPSSPVAVTTSAGPLYLPSPKIPGYFIASLFGADEVLEIKRPESNGPAFGALIYDDVQPFDSIKAASTPTLSISKKLMKHQGERLVDITTDTPLSVGDKVTVCLTLKCDNSLDYVAITDQRAGCFEPVEQLPGYIFADGLGFYRQVRDASTEIFIDRLPRGTYQLTYQTFVTQPGTFAGGIATVQSQYAPAETAHSAAAKIHVK